MPSCLVQCEQTKAENWLAFAAEIMQSLCMKRANFTHNTKWNSARRYTRQKYVVFFFFFFFLKRYWQLYLFPTHGIDPFKIRAPTVRKHPVINKYKEQQVIKLNYTLPYPRQGNITTQYCIRPFSALKTKQKHCYCGHNVHQLEVKSRSGIFSVRSQGHLASIATDI